MASVISSRAEAMALELTEELAAGAVEGSRLLRRVIANQNDGVSIGKERNQIVCALAMIDRALGTGAIGPINVAQDTIDAVMRTPAMALPDGVRAQTIPDQAEVSWTDGTDRRSL